MPDYTDPFADPAATDFGALGTAVQSPDVGRRISLANRIYPDLGTDPAALATIAQNAGSDQEMLDTLAKTYGADRLSKRVDSMKAQPDEVQQVSWDNSPTEMQGMLRQLGYTPPNERPKPDNGGWTIGIGGHDLFDVGSGGGNVAAHAVGTVLSGGMDAISAVGRPVVNILDSARDVIPHAFRAANALDEGPDQNHNRSFWDSIPASFSPSEWSDAWSKTSDGMHYFDHESLNRARDVLGGDQGRLILAQEAAANPDLQVVLDKTLGRWGLDKTRNPQEWLDGVQRAEAQLGTPEVTEAVKQLGNGHITLGRWGARNLFGQNDFSDPTGPGSLISGALDAYITIRTDPVVLADKGLHIVRSGLWAADKLSETLQGARALDQGIDPLLTGNDARRAQGMLNHATYVSDWANALAEGSPKAKTMLDANPGIQPILGDLRKWLEANRLDTPGQVTPGHILDFYASTEGKALMAGGSGGYDSARLFHITPLQQQAIRAKTWFRDSVDFLADLESTHATPNADAVARGGTFTDSFIDGTSSASQLFADKLLSAPARTLRSFYSYAPRGGKYLQLEGPGAIEEMRRYADSTLLQGATAADANDLFTKLMGTVDPMTGAWADNAGDRQRVVIQGLRRFLVENDLMNSPVADKFLNRLGQAYNMSGADELRTAFEGDLSASSVAALFPYQVAKGMAIPSARELVQATRAQSLTKALFGAANAPLLDTVMTKVWKPLVLMRMAFIPRVAGEELLRGLTHLDPSNVVRGMFSEFASPYTPVRDAAGTPIRWADGVDSAVAAWKPKLTRASDDPWGFVDRFGNRILDAEGRPLGSGYVLPDDFFTKAKLDPADPYQSMGLRWMTTVTGSLDRWANHAYDAGLLADHGPGLTGQLTRGLDGLATRFAAAAATPTGLLADAVQPLGIGSRRDIVAKLIGSDAVANYRRALDSSVVADSMAHGLATTLFSRDELDAGRGNAMRLRAEYPGTDGHYAYKDVLVDHSKQGLTNLNEPGAHTALAGKLMSATDSIPGYAEASELAHYLDPKSAGQLTQAVQQAGYGSLEEAARAAKTLTSDQREAVEAYFADPGADTKAVALASGGPIAPLLDLPPDQVNWLLHENLDPARITHDPDEILTRMADAGVREMSTPEGQRAVAKMTAARTDPISGRAVAYPPGENQTHLWMPMVQGDALEGLRQQLADPARAREVAMEMADRLRAHALPEDQIAHLVNATVHGDSGDLATLTAGLEQTGSTGRFLPAGLAASSDYDVSRTMADHLGELTGSDTALGRVRVLHSELHDTKMIHTPVPDPMQARAFTVEPWLGIKADTVHADNAVELYKHPVTGKWVRYQDLTAEERASDRLESTVSSGIPYVDAIRGLAETQSRDLLTALSNADRNAVPTVAHSVLEPLIGRNALVERSVDGLPVRAEGPDSRFSIDSFLHTSPDHLPQRVVAPELVAAQDMHPLSSFTRWFFDGPFHTGVRAISRMPLFLEAYGRRYAQLEDILGPLYRQPSVVEPATAAIDKLGLTGDAEDKLRRVAIEIDRLPAKLRDPKASIADFNGALQRSLGLDLDPAAQTVLSERNDLRSLVRTTAGSGSDLNPAERELVARWDQMTPQDFWSDVRGEAAARKATGDLPPNPADLTGPEVASVRRYLRNEGQLHSLLDEHSVRAAMGDVTPFVHDPEMRSNMQGTVGNLMPFWFAQEQFLKRWGKAIVDSPATLEKLLLLHNGVRDIGFTHTDPNTGDEVFTIPGTEQTTAALASGLNFLSGGHFDFRLPLYAAMTGTAQFALPGFTDVGLPSLGPTAGLALKAMEHIFPELGDMETPILGDRTRPDWLDYLVPSSYRNLLSGFRGDMSDPRYAQEFANQIIYEYGHSQFRDAQGNPLDPLASDHLVARIREGSRGTMVMKGLLGLLAPISGGTPQAAYLDDMNAELKVLFAEGLDPSAAYEAFRARHGDGFAMSDMFASKQVQTTERSSVAPLPTTERAFDWVNQHPDLVHAYPAAAAFLIPPQTGTDVHSRQAFNQQLTLGMRRLRTPDELIKQLYFQEAAEPYFQMESEKDALLHGADNLSAAATVRLAPWLAQNAEFAQQAATGNVRAGIEAAWSAVSAQYQKAHPVFASELTSATGRDNREAARTQLGQLLASPTLVTDDRTAAMRTLLEEYQRFNDTIVGFRTARGTTYNRMQRSNEIRNFTGWAETFTTQHPDVLSFYNSLIRGDLPSS